MSMIVNERGPGGVKVLKHKVRRLEKTGAFPLSERGHLPMRGRAFGDHANAATLENEAKLIPNLVTDSTMETEPSPVSGSVRSDVHQFREVHGRDLVGRSTIDSFYQGDVGGQASKSLIILL